MRSCANEVLRELLDRRLRSDADPGLDQMVDPLLSRESDPYAVAAGLLARIG